ncbi:MAG: response regulator transcription factor [Bacteroidia bacterium]
MDKAKTLLSDQELQIIKLIASGKSISEIAEMLVENELAIKNSRSLLLQKMKIKNNAGLVLYAINEGIVEF